MVNYKFEIFKGLTEEEKAKVLSLCKSISFRPGDIIIEEGSCDTSLYLLEKGEVEIELKIIKEKDLSFAAIQKLKSGSVIGHFAFVDHEPRSASARAISEVEALKLEYKDFEKIMEEQPRIGLKIFQNLARDLSRVIRQENVYLQMYMNYQF